MSFCQPNAALYTPYEDLNQLITSDTSSLVASINSLATTLAKVSPSYTLTINPIASQQSFSSQGSSRISDRENIFDLHVKGVYTLVDAINFLYDMLYDFIKLANIQYVPPTRKYSTATYIRTSQKELLSNLYTANNKTLIDAVNELYVAISALQHTPGTPGNDTNMLAFENPQNSGAIYWLGIL